MEQLFLISLLHLWVPIVVLAAFFLIVAVLWNRKGTEKRDGLFQKLAQEFKGEVTIDRTSIALEHVIESWTPLRTLRLKILGKTLVIQDGVEPTRPTFLWKGTYRQYLRYRDSLTSVLFRPTGGSTGTLRNTTKFFWDEDSAAAQFLSSNIRLSREKEIRIFANNAQRASSVEAIQPLPYKQFGIEFGYAMAGLGIFAILVYLFN